VASSAASRFLGGLRGVFRRAGLGPQLGQELRGGEGVDAVAGFPPAATRHFLMNPEAPLVA